MAGERRECNFIISVVGVVLGRTSCVNVTAAGEEISGTVVVGRRVTVWHGVRTCEGALLLLTVGWRVLVVGRWGDWLAAARFRYAHVTVVRPANIPPSTPSRHDTVAVATTVPRGPPSPDTATLRDAVGTFSTAALSRNNQWTADDGSMSSRSAIVHFPSVRRSRRLCFAPVPRPTYSPHVRCSTVRSLLPRERFFFSKKIYLFFLFFFLLSFHLL